MGAAAPGAGPTAARRCPRRSSAHARPPRLRAATARRRQSKAEAADRSPAPSSEPIAKMTRTSISPQPIVVIKRAGVKEGLSRLDAGSDEDVLQHCVEGDRHQQGDDSAQRPPILVRRSRGHDGVCEVQPQRDDQRVVHGLTHKLAGRRSDLAHGTSKSVLQCAVCTKPARRVYEALALCIAVKRLSFAPTVAFIARSCLRCRAWSGCVTRTGQDGTIHRLE